jgi:hypothetical protein
MLRIFGFLVSLVAISTVPLLSLPAAAVEAPSHVPQGTSVCLVGLGSGDGTPAWSQLDVTSNRSVDLDLANGTGLTVACGAFIAPRDHSATAAPDRAMDPSTKGDFGSL